MFPLVLYKKRSSSRKNKTKHRKSRGGKSRRSKKHTRRVKMQRGG